MKSSDDYPNINQLNSQTPTTRTTEKRASLDVHRATVARSQRIYETIDKRTKKAQEQLTGRSEAMSCWFAATIQVLFFL